MAAGPTIYLSPPVAAPVSFSITFGFCRWQSGRTWPGLAISRFLSPSATGLVITPTDGRTDAADAAAGSFEKLDETAAAATAIIKQAGIQGGNAVSPTQVCSHLIESLMACGGRFSRTRRHLGSLHYARPASARTHPVRRRLFSSAPPVSVFLFFIATCSGARKWLAAGRERERGERGERERETTSPASGQPACLQCFKRTLSPVRTPRRRLGALNL